MVTHEPDIARHCKRMITVRDGRIVGDETITDRLDAKEQIKVMNAERAAEDSKRSQKSAVPTP